MLYKALALIGLALCLLFLVRLATAQTLTVSRVIDGDTIDLSDGRRVRLIGIDTPEVHPSSKLRRDARESGLTVGQIQELGRLASEAARALADGRVVELTYDPVNVSDGHKGRYGRTLAYVWIVKDGKRQYMLNRRLIEGGWGEVSTFAFSRSATFRALAQEAQREGRGLWP